MRETIETFRERILILPVEDFYAAELAYVLSKYAHRHQKRKQKGPDGLDIRYFEHSRDVFIILTDVVSCYDITCIKASLVHDGPEDTRLDHNRIKAWLGQETANVVALVTRDVDDKKFFDRLVYSQNWRAILIKLCDRLANLKTMKGLTREFQQKQILETKQKYFPLLRLLPEIIPAEGLPGLDCLEQAIVDTINDLENQE